MTFAPGAGFSENGHDAARYLEALAELGPLEVAYDLSRLPRLDSLDPELSYLAWTATLETEASALAIEEVFVFAFAEGLCALGITPLDKPDARQLRAIGRDGHLLALREAQVPVVNLAACLGRRQGAFDPLAHILLIVRTQAGVPFALAAEGITDQRQVVIKSLRENYGAVPGVSAATVLGDGRIAPILDPEAVLTGVDRVPRPALVE